MTTTLERPGRSRDSRWYEERGMNDLFTADQVLHPDPPTPSWRQRLWSWIWTPKPHIESPTPPRNGQRSTPPPPPPPIFPQPRPVRSDVVVAMGDPAAQGGEERFKALDKGIQKALKGPRPVSPEAWKAFKKSEKKRRKYLTIQIPQGYRLDREQRRELEALVQRLIKGSYRGAPATTGNQPASAG